MFNDHWVEVLTGRSSDHGPMFSTMKKRGEKVWRKRSVFRYEASWAKEEGCDEVIKGAWHTMQRDIQTQKIQAKLESCKTTHERWSKQTNSDRTKEIKEKSDLLKQLQDAESRYNVEDVKKIQRELGVLLQNEDLKWKQRAKRNWYAMGDRNPKFFHACASQRRRKNVIKKVMDEQNQVFNNQEDIEGAFNNLFTSTRPSPKDIAKCVQQVEARVTSEMNDKLVRPFCRLEIEAAIQQMGPLKSPGPDGFGACFYQNHWDTIGEEVCNAVLSFLNGNSLFSSINFTYIALIPKTKSPL